MSHQCIDGRSDRHSWWEYDAHGIPLCVVCDDCRASKLARYQPVILTRYTQADVDERIEPEDGTLL